MAKSFLRESQTLSRYTDVSDEPVSFLLSAINHYATTPLVSLEEAVVLISHFFHGIEDNVFVAKQNCKGPTDGLTQDESASIHLYTMQFDTEPCLYHLFNAALRAKNRQNLEPWCAFLKLFMTALYKLPSRAQTVWRGVRDVDLSIKYAIGTQFAWWGVSSCTTSIEAFNATGFLGEQGLRTLFSIECENGKSITAHSYFEDTEEVILMPGSYFEVIGQLQPEDGLHVIQLKEIPPPAVLVKPPFVKTASPASIPTAGIVSPEKTEPSAGNYYSFWIFIFKRR